MAPKETQNGSNVKPHAPQNTAPVAKPVAAPRQQGQKTNTPAVAGPASAYVVHAPGRGAGPVVVNPSDFPSLDDTSMVGRATGLAAATNRARTGTGAAESRTAQSGHLNPSAAPMFVPVVTPQVQPRVYKTDSFTNGMIFKANNQTYGECLQRQVS